MKKTQLNPPEQTLDTMSLHDHPPAGNQTHQPQHGKHQDREQQQLRVMQERQRIVPQERNIRVVRQGGQIQRVAQERSQEVSAAREQR